MNDVFGEPTPQDTQGETPIDQPRPEVVEQIKEEAATPAADTEKHVPLAALEAERGQRRDWKEKALRAEGENKALREQYERATRHVQPQEQEAEYDPIQARLAQLETITLNASESSARKTYGSEEVDKAFEKLKASSPQLVQQALQQADPWDFVVREGRKLALLEEIGGDPASYRARIEAEIRAGTPSKPVLPTSLATTRSAGGRNAPSFTGPPPLSSMFPN